MDIQEFSDKYFETLKAVVGNSSGYDHLLRGLYSREFYSPLELDSNRAAWGIWFRRRYMTNDEAAQLGPCTVLEMMIALSEQIDIHGVEFSNEERIHRYFWMMVENLDMLGMTDVAWGPNSDRDFNNKIDILLDRRYGDDGVGSLFPLRLWDDKTVANEQKSVALLQFRERTTMRDRDIWAQLCLFDVSAWEKWKGFC